MKQHRPRLALSLTVAQLCRVCGRRIVWVEQREHCAAHLRHAPRTNRTAVRYTDAVGISDATVSDNMCDALLVADTSREGVSRLEVSAP